MTEHNEKSTFHSSHQKEQRAMSRSAFKVSVAGLIGLVTGLVSQMVIAAIFGAGKVTDAYLTALTLPIYLQAVLISGLSFVFIPAFVKDVTEGREEDAWALVGAFFWLLGVILVPVALVIAIFAKPVLNVVAPGLDSSELDLAAQMLVVVSFTVPFAGYAAFTGSIQNARHHFFWPAARSAVNSVVNVIVVLLLYPSLGGMALAWGYLAAMGMEAAITTTPVIRHGWTRMEAFTSERVVTMFKLMAPLVLFGVLTRIIPVLERYYASSLPAGDLSYLGYANKINRIFQGLFGVSIVTTIFPMMSKAYAQDGDAGLMTHFSFGVRLTLAVSFPVVGLVSVVALPFAAVLFERGAFTHSDTLHVAQIIPMVLVRAVLFTMMSNLLSRAFYVTKDTRTVPVVSTLAVFAYFPLAYYGVQWWGYVGLAVASMIQGGISIAILSLLLVHRFALSTVIAVVRSSFLYFLLAAVVSVLAWLCMPALAEWPYILQLSVISVMAALLYIVALLWVDPEITTSIFEVTGVQRVLDMRIVGRLRARLRLGFQ